MATETEGIQAQSADISDTTVIVPVTGAIYHNGNEKPTERWCFELGMRTVSGKDFTSVLSRLQKGFGIKEKCAMLKIVKFKIQLSSKDFRPKLPEWPKGRIFQIDTQEQWETALPQIISHQREMIAKSCSDFSMLHFREYIKISPSETFLTLFILLYRLT